MTVVLGEHAIDDLRRARDRYAQVDPALSERFADAVDAVIARIMAFPRGAPPVDGFPGLRVPWCVVSRTECSTATVPMGIRSSSSSESCTAPATPARTLANDRLALALGSRADCHCFRSLTCSLTHSRPRTDVRILSESSAWTTEGLILGAETSASVRTVPSARFVSGLFGASELVAGAGSVRYAGGRSAIRLTGAQGEGVVASRRRRAGRRFALR